MVISALVYLTLCPPMDAAPPNGIAQFILPLQQPDICNQKLPFFSEMGKKISFRCSSVFVLLDLCKWFWDIFSRDVGNYIPHSSLMISFKSIALKVLLDWARNEWPTSTGGPYQLCEGFGLVRNGWMNYIIDPLWSGSIICSFLGIFLCTYKYIYIYGPTLIFKL